MKITPLLRWLFHPDLVEELESDLDELFQQRVKLMGLRKARWRYLKDALSLVRPSLLKWKPVVYQYNNYPQPTNTTMIRNYVKIAWRNLVRNKSYSAINIVGLSVGMTVAMLIGLWVYDELSFNSYHQNHDRIAQVLENETLENGVQTFSSLPMPLSQELRTKYPNDFKYVVASTAGFEQIIAYQDKKFTKTGNYAEAEFPDLMTLKMIKGTRSGLKDPNSVLLSESVAKALFGDADPLQKAVKIGNKYTVQVTGVYEDLPHNSAFTDVTFVAPIDLLFENKEDRNNWRSSSFDIFTQLNPNSRFDDVSVKIKDLFRKNAEDENRTRSALFLHPMNQWHLYSTFENGVNAGGRIQFVWLFSIIGVFVLLLACINFMNLSTARSQKRAKEVGIRKAIGSQRGQLIGQFFSESFLVVALSFGLSLAFVWFILPYFNEVADKQLVMHWTDARFWIFSIGFSLFTGIVAGSYPALYLSSFQPIKVLKGHGPSLRFNIGRFASIPRKVLVVMQFTVSVTLIIGTIIVFRQIQFAKNRPIGYSREGLINITMNTPEIQGNYDAVRNELLATGVVADMGESSSPITGIWSSANNLDWRGKDPNRAASFGTILVTPDFGKVVGWKIKEGREFSRQFTSDSSTFLLNEAAVKLTGLKNPVGEIIKWHGKNWKVLGVVKDMVMTSPFEPVTPTVFMIDSKERGFNIIHIKLNPTVSVREALPKLEAVFKKINPAAPFEYRFADQEYTKKFAAEERIGTLASIFAILAIFISCLGLFGLSSFMAEQRIKEIGVRKVLGATVPNIVSLLSRDFLLLVFIAFLVASPVAWYTMDKFLQAYKYRIAIEWWVFALTGALAIGIALLTVSFQSIKAALMNPVTSLRSE
ncbi:FtsX-like permease family protein [Spirosoma sp. KCTC 42546]|uniref:ABC transporter permease n=1 Tax=Spirosoma sp. KCTC 42546 TaxID=2520506 RepID=UPI001157631F|nr:ABC transporter permease [Spirosoma sp. KCTC 42546]QDK79062.1 FtsX-like permease family protein [Spirosoma sp. KCTC 42546]